MDFTPTDSENDLTGLVREIGERLVTDSSLADLDARFGPGTESGGTGRDTARLHERLWTELVRAGVPAALGPGGSGPGESEAAAERPDDLGVVTEALVLRELGRVLAPVPVSSAIRAATLLSAAGDSPTAEAVLSGETLAAVADTGAATAPADGSPAALGEVDWAPVADVVLAPYADGTVLVADTAATGVTIERTVPVDYSCAGTVTLDGSGGGPGSGVRSLTAPAPLVARDALHRRVHLAAYQWGVVEAALERTVAYASEREQFGRKIGTFQAVSSRLSDAYIDVDAVRLTTLRAAFELDAAGGDVSAAAVDATATAHFWACETGHRVAHSAVHIHGGVGLDRDHPLHRYFTTAKAVEFRLGGATSQLLDLGDALVDSGDPWA